MGKSTMQRQIEKLRADRGADLFERMHVLLKLRQTEEYKRASKFSYENHILREQLNKKWMKIKLTPLSFLLGLGIGILLNHFIGG